MAYENPTRTAQRPGTLRYLARHEHALWAIAIFALIADIGLTAYGLELGAVELNPYVAWVIAEFYLVGMVVMKFGALAVALIGRWLIPNEYGSLVPVALAVPWVFVSVMNVFTIAALW
ncbi:DUF5658 family protein [Halomarina rubra]|uniref:DUF5658 family protein n=1 Tax=Halomarina rubra TaxID=2071873 RepID=A0ABD6AW42_9EURY|nr:DUF5658 family protein [Halomarina rubra]